MSIDPTPTRGIGRPLAILLFAALVVRLLALWMAWDARLVLDEQLYLIRADALLRGEGWRVNQKQIHSLFSEECLSIRSNKPKRHRSDRIGKCGTILHASVSSLRTAGSHFCSDEYHEKGRTRKAVRFSFWASSELGGSGRWRSLLFRHPRPTPSIVVLDGTEIVHEERLLKDLGERIRDVRQGPDGHLYLLTESPKGRLLRLDPIQ